MLLRLLVLNCAASGMELLKMWFFFGLCASIFDIGLKLHFCGTQHNNNGGKWKNTRKLSKNTRVMVRKQQIIVPAHFQLWTKTEFAELFILNFRKCHPNVLVFYFCFTSAYRNEKQCFANKASHLKFRLSLTLSTKFISFPSGIRGALRKRKAKEKSCKNFFSFFSCCDYKVAAVEDNDK